MRRRRRTASTVDSLARQVYEDSYTKFDWDDDNRDEIEMYIQSLLTKMHPGQLIDLFKSLSTEYLVAVVKEDKYWDKELKTLHEEMFSVLVRYLTNEVIEYFA